MNQLISSLKSKKKKNIILLLIIATILILIGGFYLWQKQTRREEVRAVQKNCSLTPYAENYEGLSANNKPSIKQYVVPINCSEFIVFKRQGSGNDDNEWNGTFRVYFRENDSEKYLFKHQGLLRDISGSTPWDVSEEENIIHLSLGFADMGASASWDYYISRSNKELLIGLNNSLDILVGDNRKYELKLDTTPVWCPKENTTRITKSIIYNDKKYKLPNKILESCEEDELSFFPPPKITVLYLDMVGNKITLDIPQNKAMVFDYNKGEFIE